MLLEPWKSARKLNTVEDGRTPKEISETTGVPVHAVYKEMIRGRTGPACRINACGTVRNWPSAGASEPGSPPTAARRRRPPEDEHHGKKKGNQVQVNSGMGRGVGGPP